MPLRPLGLLDGARPGDALEVRGSAGKHLHRRSYSNNDVRGPFLEELHLSGNVHANGWVQADRRLGSFVGCIVPTCVPRFLVASRTGNLPVGFRPPHGDQPSPGKVFKGVEDNPSILSAGQERPGGRLLVRAHDVEAIANHLDDALRGVVGDGDNQTFRSLGRLGKMAGDGKLEGFGVGTRAVGRDERHRRASQASDGRWLA